MKNLFIIASLVLLMSSTAIAQKAIILNEECVYLDQLTAKTIPHIEVYCGLQPGENKLFTKDQIQNYLLREGINAKVINDVNVKRSGEKISEESFTNKLIELYSQDNGDIELIVEQVRIPSNVYAEENNSFEVIADTTKFGGNYAQIKIGTKKFQAYYYIKAYKDAFVTTNRLKAGDLIDGNYIKEKVDVTNIKGKLITDINKLQATKSMPKGKILTQDLVEAKPELKKGETVKIVYNNGILAIETKGVIEENATLGQPVSVKNINSQKIITALYVGNGVVKANF